MQNNHLKNWQSPGVLCGTWVAITILLSGACHSKMEEEKSPSDQASHWYEEARQWCTTGNLDTTFVMLEKAFEEGLDDPMRIVRDTVLNVLIRDKDFRPNIRQLVQTFALNYQTTMVDENEPGESIMVTGQILSEHDSLPLKDVSVEFVHTDDDGFYFRENTLWNPRLFAYLKTNSDGLFQVRTIRPGTYEGDEGIVAPAHIHFTLQKDGYRTYASEFTFEDDPIFLSSENVDNVPVASRQTNTGPTAYQVTIYLQPL